MKTLLVVTLLGAGLGAMQLIPVTGGAANVGAPGKIAGAGLQAPVRIQDIMNKACLNCHSNHTLLPWYAKVAPVSWVVARDVERARKAVNFSEWAAQTGGKPYAAMGTLVAACADLKTGRMPTPQYRLMHPEARLSQQEVNSFCAWTIDETRRLRAGVALVQSRRKQGASFE
jgi:hypothetical protein